MRRSLPHSPPLQGAPPARGCSDICFCAVHRSPVPHGRRQGVTNDVGCLLEPNYIRLTMASTINNSAQKSRSPRETPKSNKRR
ncbi:hypothetical protein J6590_065084 [Homalodisca vitripennis]|nr:hypothetical protein J6590_065084 [Homalodisca vitripennis]